MASFMIITKFASLIITMFLIMKVVKADKIDLSIPPDSNDVSESTISYSPEPTSDPTLVQCTSGISLYCAAQVIENDELYAIAFEAKCCKQLIDIGKACNDLLVHYLITEFGASKSQKRSIDMHERSDYLWKKCLDVVNYGESVKVLPFESSKRWSGNTMIGAASLAMQVGQFVADIIKRNH